MKNSVPLLIRICFTLVFLSINMKIDAENDQKKYLIKCPVYQGFTGGMMLHTGYAWGNIFQAQSAGGQIGNYHVQGWTTGIGGRMALRFNTHWRVGMEGAVSTTHYGDHRSYETGWGGLLIDYQWHIGKFHPFVSAVIGGGSATNMLTIESPNNNLTAQDVVWRKYSLFLLSPNIGVEYSLTERISLILKMDYLFSPTASSREPDYATGPRIYFGFMFNK